jgi:hypothetical protein
MMAPQERDPRKGRGMNDEVLRAKARDLIRAGRLPGRRPERIWGGAGLAGIRCTLCGEAIGRGDVVLEIEVRGGEGASYPQLHVHCFSVFETALGDPESAPAVDRFGHENAA